jgi:hypothetical protein
MGGLLFSNAALLAGLGALALPILIHLLLKQRRKPMRFSTIQFFLKRDETASQRRRLRNWLLLSLRLLLLALLVLAFARPYLQGSAGAQSPRQRQQLVLVLDRSASMQAGERWAKANEWLQKAVARLAPDDRVAIVDCGGPAEIIAPLGPPEALKPVLQKLQPGFGTSDLAAGLTTAVRLLAQSGAGGALRIELISDLQKSACAHLAEISVPKAIDLTISPAAETALPNLAVDDLVFDRSRSAMVAHVSNYSPQDATRVKPRLIVDGVSSAQPELLLAAEEPTQISLTLPHLEPGWHSIEARIAPQDGFPLDDVRYQTASAPKPQRVLCVEQRPVAHLFEEETFFIVSALAPATNAGPYAVEKCGPDEAAARLARAGDRALVVLPGLGELPPDLAPALRTFVGNGGGLILFLGDKLNPARYNEELHDLLPAVLGHSEGDDEQPENFWHLLHYQRAGLIFAAFEKPNSGDVTLPVFRHRFTLSPSADSAMEAALNDGTPLIVSKKLGRGCIVLVNTSADTAWTDWPKRKTFLPWLYGLAAYATQRTPADAAADDPPLLAGMPGTVALGARAANSPLRVHRPDGQIVPAVADARGRVSLDPERPGIYSIQDSAGRELRRVAVNLASSESDLRSFAPSELDIPRSDDAPKSGLVSGVLGDNHRELWRFLLVAALALVFLEPLLANRSYA